MKFKSQAKRPETGMDMTVTVSMGAAATTEECRDAMIAFFKGVEKLAEDTSGVWFNISVSNIPEEFRAALESMEWPQPKIRLVVNND